MPVHSRPSAHVDKSFLLHKFGHSETNGHTGNQMTVDRDDIRGCLVDMDVIRNDEPLDADDSLFDRGLID